MKPESALALRGEVHRLLGTIMEFVKDFETLIKDWGKMNGPRLKSPRTGVEGFVSLPLRHDVFDGVL